MNFLALFLGLGIERLLTQVFHWREFHWLDPLFDLAFRKLKNCGAISSLIASLGTAVLIVAPVGILQLSLQGRLAHIPLFAFAVVVLLFCLGPRDLGEEVDDFREAIAKDDQEEIRKLTTELLQMPPGSESSPDIEEAIYAQANNRIFAVVFWFALLGPTAAWFFRVLDLMRQRAIHHFSDHLRSEEGEELPQIVRATLALHRLAAWIPARLLMVGYVLAGSYDGATVAWRKSLDVRSDLFPGPDDRRLGLVGRGAAPNSEAVDVSTRAAVALKLVVRVLWMIWCPALALLTLYGWIN